MSTKDEGRGLVERLHQASLITASERETLLCLTRPAPAGEEAVERAFEAWNKGDISNGLDDRREAFVAGFNAATMPGAGGEK